MLRDHPYNTWPGWWPMLDELMAKAWSVAADAEHDEKEKYGRCVLYLRSEGSPQCRHELQAIEREAADRSLEICEICGRPGRLRADRSWIQTLCDRCEGLGEAELSAATDAAVEAYWEAVDAELEAAGFEISWCDPVEDADLIAIAEERLARYGLLEDPLCSEAN